MLRTLLFLTISNIFMNYAWYGHLKDLKDKPLFWVIVASWGVAFFEYCFQVPANRIGHTYFTLPQLKILQEVITLVVFACFSIFYMKEAVNKNFVYASLCLGGAVFFIFRGR